MPSPHKFYRASTFKFLFAVFCIFNTQNLLAQSTNIAERPMPIETMPAWAKVLYQDVSKINFKELDAAFKKWDEAQEKEKEEIKLEKATGLQPNPDDYKKYIEQHFEENPYEEYYKRLRHKVAPYIQRNGFAKIPSATELELKRKNAAEKKLKETANTQLLTRTTTSTTWTPVGPLETRFDLSVDPNQAVCPWQVNIYAFDIALSNPNILYCATETGIVSKTTDKGLNWSSVGLDFFNTTQTAISVDPTHPNIVFTGFYGGLNASFDGGTSWNNVFTQDAFSANVIKFKPNNTNIVLAGGSNMQLGTITGTNVVWTQVMDSLVYDMTFKTDDPNTVFALVQHGDNDPCQFWKSTDGGQTWSVRSTGWPIGLMNGGGRLNVTAADGNRIYAILLTGGGPRFAISIDAGETWTITNPAIALTSFDQTSGQGYYDLGLVVSQTDANQVIFGITSAYKSTDGGATFAAFGGYTGAFEIHPDIQDMKAVGADTWIATDGGITYSSDFFSTTANASARIKGILGSDFWGFSSGWNEDVFVGGRYHNGNTSWRESYPTGQFMRLGGGEQSTGYINPGNNSLAYFSDIGSYILPKQFNQPLVQFPVSKYPSESYYSMQYSEQKWDPRYSNTYYLGNANVLWKTTDNGANFSAVYTLANSASLVRHIEISRSNPNVIYFTEEDQTANANDGAVWKSTNGGASFTKCTQPTGTIADDRVYATISLSGTDDKIIWLAYRTYTDGTKIYKSTDGGTTWTNLTTGTLSGLQIADMVHQLGTDGGVYIICDFGRVFYLNNSLSDWMPYSIGLPKVLTSEIIRVKPFYRDGKLRLGTEAGIWETGLYENAATTLVQPMSDKSITYCLRDTFNLESYSVSTNPTGFLWSFSPAPAYISSTTARNPKVVFGTAGNYSVTLSVTDGNGTTSRTIANFISVQSTGCMPDTIPSTSITFSGSTTSQAFSNNPAPNFGATQDFSVSFWMKSSSTIIDGAMVTDKDWDSGRNKGWVFSLSSGRIWFNIGDGTNRIDMRPSTTWNDGTWHHIAASITRTGSAVLYIDGISVGSVSMSAIGDIYTGNVLSMGMDPLNHWQYAGQLEEVKIWNRALTQNDVREQMHLTAYTTDANLINYFQFNNTSTTEYDRKGSLHLTLSADAVRTASTAPIGGGTSFRMTVNTGGIKDFSVADCLIEFPATGTYPNGEIVVSKLNVSPDQSPTGGTPLAGKYWIVRNFGTNATFTALPSIQFNNIKNISGANPAASNAFSLFKRNTNGEGATWGTKIADASSVAANTNGTGNLKFSTGLNNTSFSQFAINATEAQVALKVFLQGPFSGGQMNDGLRSLGYIPTTTPYGGTETIDPSVLTVTGTNAIVDWIKIELRDQTTPISMVVQSRSALLQRNGAIVETDGVSPVFFTGVSTAQNYYIAIQHRNHLGFRTASAIGLSTSTTTTLDFTNNSTPIYTLSPLNNVSGVYMMYAGDADGNNTINATDRSTTWNNRNKTGYLLNDFSLNGTVDATDRSHAWNNRNKTASF